MTYLYLALSIASCVAGPSLLTASDGMRRRGLAAGGVALFILAYALLSRVVTAMNVSIAYAIFCGGSIIAAAVVSRVLFHQRMTRTGIACMVLILAACIFIHLFGTM